MSVNVWSRARTLSRKLGRPDIDPLGRLVFDDKGRRLVLPTSLSGTSALQRECSAGLARMTTFAGVPVAEVAADVELLEEVTSGRAACTPRSGRSPTGETPWSARSEA